MRKTVKRISALTAAFFVVLCMITPLIPSGRVFADGAFSYGTPEDTDADSAGGYWTLVDTDIEKMDETSDLGQSWTYKASELVHERHYQLEENVIGKRTTSSPMPGIIVPGEAFTLTMVSELTELVYADTGSDGKLTRKPMQWLGKYGEGEYGSGLYGTDISKVSTTGAVSITYTDSSVGYITTDRYDDEIFTLTTPLSNTVNYSVTVPEGKEGEQFQFVFYGFGTSTNTGYSNTTWTYEWTEASAAKGRWVLSDTNLYKSEDAWGQEFMYSQAYWTYEAGTTSHTVSFESYYIGDDNKVDKNRIVESGKGTVTCDVPPGVLYAGETYRLGGTAKITEYTLERIIFNQEIFYSDFGIAAGAREKDPDRVSAKVVARATESPQSDRHEHEASGSFEFKPYEGRPGDVFAVYFVGNGATTEWLYEWTEDANAVPGGNTDPGPIDQEIITPGADKPGEDSGTDIIPEIVEGSKDPKPVKNVGIAVGGALVAGGAAALINGKGDKGGGDDDKKKKKPSGYRMYVNKNFGNMLKRGEEAKFVYARIAELPSGGGEFSRDDLSRKIEVFSGDGVLEVTDGGFTSNGYRAARVKVPDDCTAATGQVSFRYAGEGGTFTRHVVFALTAAQIIFPQDNLGLPAGKLKYVKKAPGKDGRIGDGTYILPFAVKDMPQGSRVKAVIERVGSTTVNGHYISSSKIDKPMPYTVEAEPDKEYADKGIYNAVIKETEDYELEAGINEGFILRVTAEYGKAGSREYEKAEGELPIFRIHLGLALTVEAKSIPCYVKLKPGRENKNREDITGEDLEVQYANASLMLLLCDESDLSIIRVAVNPEMDAGGKRPKKLKVTPTQVGNDRYSRTGDANESHQKICDALGITAFPTGVVNEIGAHKLKICITDGIMDPPTRMLADIELSAVYEGKTYTAKKNVLLRSQEFRIAQNADDDRKFLERDKHVTEQLLRISEKIEHEYPQQLFSLANMIDRMLEGYDPRFGFDENQLNNVMGMWTGFLEGSFAGANGTPQGVTFADELAAVYAFMQGLRDNTGFLGRVAMGVMTSGVSEYIFTTMTVAEKMRDAVFKCKGDKDFGFWDGVEIGVTEFGKQILLEVTMGAAIKKLGNTNLGYKIGEKLGDMASKYRSAMDAMDSTLKNNIKLYKMADDAFTGCKNFFNSSAKAAKAGIDETIKSADDALDYGDMLMKKARNELSPQELKALERFERGMEKGMEKVRKLQKAQQELESITDPAKLKEAKANYRKIADEVWTDKNALKALQRVKGEPAARLKAQFNEYRETLLDEVQLEALSDISRETGIPRENLYVMNASNGSKLTYKQGKRVPSDRDISFKQKVLSDRTKDLTIDESLGKRAVARRLYKKMNGREADTIEEALQFMKDKDVTYVSPEKSGPGSFEFEHNLEAYEDLAGMIGIKPDGTMDKSLMENDLHNLQINRASVEHKGVEWFSRSRQTVDTAKSLEQEAANLTGEAREALLKRAEDLMDMSQGQMVEGVYQISKQVENIIIPRGILRTGRCPLSREAMIIHQQALKVANCEVPPAVFERFLKNNYGMDIDGYAKYMSQFLE